jgi:hypothetical protein
MSGQIPAGDVAGGEGEREGSTRSSWATCGWSWGGSGWPESGCPWRAGPAAGGARRQGVSGVRRRKRTGWGGAVGHGEAGGATDLGRGRAEGEVPRRPELTAASMEAASSCTRAGRVWGVIL